jgi:hypothetical protein
MKHIEKNKEKANKRYLEWSLSLLIIVFLGWLILSSNPLKSVSDHNKTEGVKNEKKANL